MVLNKKSLFYLLPLVSSLTGCGMTQHAPNPSHVATTVSVPSSKLPTSIQNTANAIFSLYGANQLPVPSMTVKQTWTDNNHQKMYVVSATGSFRQSANGSVATKISFSVLADSSKAWALVATNNQGKTLWNQDSFSGTPITLHYTGSGRLWHGSFVSSLTYSVKDSTGGDSGSTQNVYLKNRAFRAGGSANGVFPAKTESPKVSVQWGGHSETFLLHSVKP